MFTIQQIHEAHAKVKSGADFPKYMQDIIALGVTFSETLTIADESNIEQFKSDLKSHQQGNTDYMTFLHDCAKSGVEKWVVVMDKMTCSYYDKAGNEMVVEVIPLV